MRRFGLVFAAVAAVPILLAAPVPKAVKKPNDVERIVGAWAENPTTPSCWVFRADGTAGVGDPDNPGLQALYKIAPDQTPKHLDWSQDGGKTWYLGVYELDDDTLRISFGGGGNGIRPPNVDKGNGFQYISATRRVKDK